MLIQIKIVALALGFIEFQTTIEIITPSRLEIFSRRRSAIESDGKEDQIVTFVSVLNGKRNHKGMFKRLKELYQQYKSYVRVDLVMYAVLVLMIIFYFIYSTVFGK